ncbi:MAG: hypothetical protein K9H64_06605 [Bacteroidales bacterium]|nr:hypothetical protein [Bacteroidales bacterium]MCF8455405.1 hypothetical protein [Bacteroidales bacterium]
MKDYIILILFVLTNLLSNAQSDSIRRVKYTPDFQFTEGVYLSFEQVRNNNPIPKSRIVSNQDIDDIQFFDKLFEEDKLVLFDKNGMKTELKKEEVWGYCKLGAIYIYHNEDFNRIPVIGSISHFVATETIENYRGYDPYYRSYDPYYSNNTRGRFPTTSKELRQYMLDFETGQVLDYNHESLKVFLMRDPALYEEFNNLSRRKQKKMVFMFLRRFNEQNPLMIPVKSIEGLK